MRLAIAAALASIAALPAFATAPRIEHAPPRLTAGKPLRIEARIDAETGVFRPRLYWRNAGETDWRDTALEPRDGAFVATIPAADVKGDVEYYLQAFDKGDISAEALFASREAPQRLQLVRPKPRQPAFTASVEEAPSGKRSTVAAWSLIGAAAVAAGAGTAFGLAAKSAANDIPGAASVADYETRADKARGLAKGATVAWIAAGVLGAAGAGFLVWRF